MSESLSSNKRIAKNTMYLYMRMLVVMAVSIYTSRVILQTLGAEDYGIYGVVGGIVGVIGGLGGFVCPILFGYLLKVTGLWTSCWLLLALISVVCLVWMHVTILKMAKQVPTTE